MQFHQTATWWRVIGTGGYGGKKFASPNTFKVRWEDRQEEFRNIQGQLDISQAIVFCSDKVAPKVGDYLMQGDATATADPTTLDGAFAIRQVVRTPDLRSVTFEKRLIL